MAAARAIQPTYMVVSPRTTLCSKDFRIVPIADSSVGRSRERCMDETTLAFGIFYR